MNRDPVRAIVCASKADFEAAGPGAIFLWRFSDKAAGYALVKCPGCGDESAMHLRPPGSPHPDDSQSWEASGTPDKLTFSPSVNCVGCCGWHGWLKDGVFAI